MEAMVETKVWQTLWQRPNVTKRHSRGINEGYGSGQTTIVRVVVDTLRIVGGGIISQSSGGRIHGNRHRG